VSPAASLCGSLPNLDKIDDFTLSERPASAQDYYQDEEEEEEQERPSPVADPVEANRMAWECGQPDYLGVNAFDNIMAKLDAALDQNDESNHYWQESGYDSGWSQPHHEEVVEERQEEEETWAEADQDADDEDSEEEEKEEDVAVDNTAAVDAHVVEEQEEEEVIAQEEVEEDPIPLDHRQDWEVGRPDYRGKASFDLILRRIEVHTGLLRRKESPSSKPFVGATARDQATQTPALATPYNPALRRVQERGRAHQDQAQLRSARLALVHLSVCPGPGVFRVVLEHLRHKIPSCGDSSLS